MFYGESLDVFVFVGAGLIICGVLWNLLAESRQARISLSTRLKKPQAADA
jgi:drug/metabolite transporter (DMT)-like permease